MSLVIDNSQIDYNLKDIRCPKCRAKLINYTTISSIQVRYYYCPSLRCRVKRVIVDLRDNSIIHIDYYKNIEQKKKALLRSFRNNYKYYSVKTKRKVRAKYVKLYNELHNELNNL